MTTENIEAVCVWQDSQGDRTESGDYPWIVSLDVLDDAGRAVTTRTLDVCDTEDEALASGRDSAAEHGLPLPRLGYSGGLQYDLAGACAGELMHRDSGCKNVTTAPLRPYQVEEVAKRILAARQARHESETPYRDKRAAANAFLGRCNMGFVEIGDDLMHAQRSSDGAVAVIELVDGHWIARPPKAGERIYV